MNAYEDISYWTSGLPRSSSKESADIRHWHDGWVDEIADKLRKLNILISNDKENREINTRNKHAMEWAIDHVNAIKTKLTDEK